MNSLTKEHLQHLLSVMANVDCAIVEARGLGRLSVRVPEESVGFVTELFDKHWPVVMTVEVSSLGYVQPFVQGIHIFA